MLKKTRAPPASVREVSSCSCAAAARLRLRRFCPLELLTLTQLLGRSILVCQPRHARGNSLLFLLAPPCLQVRAVAVCRPVVDNDSRRLSAAGAPTSVLQELDILEPAEQLPAGSPDADLYRDISVEREGSRGSVLRLPLYGYRGGAGVHELCEREVAPLLQRLLAGESCAVIAYGQTGAWRNSPAGDATSSSTCWRLNAQLLGLLEHALTH